MPTREIRIEWKGEAGLAPLARDPGIEIRAGKLRLARRVVLVDETGNCNGRDVERVHGTSWARKEFWLDSVNVARATISAWARCAEETATLIIEVNGHAHAVQPVPHAQLRSRDNRPGPRYWEDGWRTVTVPSSELRPGLNAVVLRTEDGSEWETLIEACRWPNRSAKSIDGGKTWDFDHLGFNDCYDGEYLVRMELERYPARATATSAPVDLSSLVAGNSLGQPLGLRGISVHCDATLPEGTSIEIELRSGPTPSYDPALWSAWQEDVAYSPGADHRFAQWRATLLTGAPLETPVLHAVLLTASAEGAKLDWGHLLAAENPAIIRPSRPFGYQPPTRRTEMLRNRWHLDQVVDGCQDDFEQIVRLAHWTREQWTDGWDPEWKALHLCPPWDAPLILELGRHDLARGMCTHYATVFVHACAALGIPARHVIHKSHCTAEAWSDRWQRWIWVDAGAGPSENDETLAVYHVERDGVPLSALEARAAWLSGDTRSLRLVGRNAERVFCIEERLELLDRFCIELRNDHMTSLSPGEPEHGTVPYHYDGYLWWRDQDTAPLPQFSQSSGRVEDFYWTPNRTRIHLQRTQTRGVLSVQLETSMPHLAVLEARLDDGAWQETPTPFEWHLKQGQSRLAARSVSEFGTRGPASWVLVGLGDANWVAARTPPLRARVLTMP